MTSAKLSHLQINISADNLAFYRELFTFLGWDRLFSDTWGEAFNSAGDVSLWFMTGANDSQTNYDGVGVNHIALAADSQAEVDATTTWLTERGVATRFDTPRHRPDFVSEEGRTYYQVMFESPDGILFEHVYIGTKQD